MTIQVGGQTRRIGLALSGGGFRAAAFHLGVFRKLHEGTLEYTKQRKQFGQPISQFQVLQHRMVDMFINLEQSISMTYMANIKLADDDVERAKGASAAKVQIAQRFKTRTRDQWCELLEGTDVCFAPVLDFGEAPQHPHLKARGTFVEVDGVTQPAPAPRFSRSVPAKPRPLAQDRLDELLAERGASPVTSA